MDKKKIVNPHPIFLAFSDRLFSLLVFDYIVFFVFSLSPYISYEPSLVKKIFSIERFTGPFVVTHSCAS